MIKGSGFWPWRPREGEEEGSKAVKAAGGIMARPPTTALAHELQCGRATLRNVARSLMSWCGTYFLFLWMDNFSYFNCHATSKSCTHPLNLQASVPHVAGCSHVERPFKHAFGRIKNKGHLPLL